MHTTTGLHHITAITGNPQKNLNFYEGFLGQRLIKKTVNHDDPNAYHLYYADAVGTPGTVITFFYWAHMPAGKRGAGEAESIYYTIPVHSFTYWKTRAQQHNIATTEIVLPFGEQTLMLQDPDGLSIGLVAADTDASIVHWNAGPIPPEHAIRGFYGVLLSLPTTIPIAPVITDGLGYEVVDTIHGTTRYQTSAWPGKYIATREEATLPRARQGTGSIHHIAVAVATDTERNALKQQLETLGLLPTGLIDRYYFHSTYVMTPPGILFEIATSDIGFTIDEPVESLGDTLVLPEHFAADRALIEARLPPLVRPARETTTI